MISARLRTNLTGNDGALRAIELCDQLSYSVSRLEAKKTGRWDVEVTCSVVPMDDPADEHAAEMMLSREIDKDPDFSDAVLSILILGSGTDFCRPDKNDHAVSRAVAGFGLWRDR